MGMATQSVLRTGLKLRNMFGCPYSAYTYLVGIGNDRVEQAKEEYRGGKRFGF